MDWKILALLQLAVVGVICGTLSAHNTVRMISEINASSKGSAQTADVGFYPGKAAAIRNHHRRIFPASKCRKLNTLYRAMTIASFIIAAIALLI
ncbi:hypothetical protein FHR23_001103 [Stakelama sediminis]|uniref:Uncharacterized protein n=1 Tax=Stakelama sediminis TaxID=463200 RepID=A0A840YXD4_9SPHN|nr:hypothetical protein [Stakelama sediminis]MBB5718196.1 hypothetical protein [Stakelama sediminis]